MAINYSNAENKSITVILIISLLSIYGLILISSVLGIFGDLYYNNFGSLTLPSLFLFFIIAFASGFKEKYYFFFLIFILLAFPAPVDDIFPSVRFSNFDDADFTVFPLITRIDLYLLLGILIKLGKNNFKFPYLKLPLFHKIFIVLAVPVFYLNLVLSRDLWDVNLLLSHSFHIRYYILSIVLISLYDINKYQKELIFSFVLSLIFLVLESYFNTRLNGLDRLTSGSLSLNTFANIASAIALFFLYLRKRKKISLKLTIVVFVLFLIIVIGSATRGAFLTFIVSLFLLLLIENPKKVLLNLLKSLVGVSLILYAYFYASDNKILPQRYSYEHLAKKLNIDLSQTSLKRIFQIKESWETSSLVTRLNLFDSSLNMIGDNPVLGIGAGRWNRYKNTYVDDVKIEKVLLDTHNDYLALLSQYGIILGFVMIYLIFFYPRSLFQTLSKSDSSLKYLYVIPFSMGIAAISNSGFFKHQVASILILCLAILTKLYEDENRYI